MHTDAGIIPGVISIMDSSRVRSIALCFTIYIALISAQTYPADVLVSTCPPSKHRKVVEYAQDCRKYIYCFEGKKYYFRCYDGFVFDPCLKRCVYSSQCVSKDICPDTELVGNLEVSPPTQIITSPPRKFTDNGREGTRQSGGLYVKVRENGQNLVDVMETLPELPKKYGLPLANDAPTLDADKVLIEVSGESKQPKENGGNLQVNVKTESEAKIGGVVGLTSQSFNQHTTFRPPPQSSTSGLRDNTYIIRVVFSPKEKPEDVYDNGDGGEDEVEEQTDRESLIEVGEKTSTVSEAQYTVPQQSTSGTTEVTDLVTPVELQASTEPPFSTIAERTPTTPGFSEADNLVSASTNEVAQVLNSDQEQSKTGTVEEFVSGTTLAVSYNYTEMSVLDSRGTLAAVIDQLRNESWSMEPNTVNDVVQNVTVPIDIQSYSSTDIQTSSSTDISPGVSVAEDESLVNATIDDELNSNDTLASYALMMSTNNINNEINDTLQFINETVSKSVDLTKTQDHLLIFNNTTVLPETAQTFNQVQSEGDLDLGKPGIPALCNLTAAGGVCDCGSANISESKEEVESRCSRLSCLNGGMYVTLSNGHCGCVCPVGYKGNTCEQLTDPTQCFCANGGKCVQMDQGLVSSSTPVYSCQCPLGYLGGQCQYRIDAIQRRAASLLSNPDRGRPDQFNQLQIDLTKFKFCDINPCLNAGFCLQHIESLERQCYCTNNYGGVLCHRKCRNC